jgi:hypothetical protein
MKEKFYRQAACAAAGSVIRSFPPCDLGAASAEAPDQKRWLMINIRTISSGQIEGRPVRL